MATRYKTEIQLTSLNVNYSEEEMNELIKELLENNFVNVEVNTKELS